MQPGDYQLDNFRCEFVKFLKRKQKFRMYEHYSLFFLQLTFTRNQMKELYWVVVRVFESSTLCF